MRIKFILFLSILLTESALSAAKIDHWETSQGVPVYYIETTTLPMVDIEIIFDAGSSRDGDQHGVASLTSALLDTGAGNLNADQIAQNLESVGAQLGTGISRDMASISLRTLTEKKLLTKSLDTLQTILTQPSFNEADFQREKNRTIANLKYREELPGAIANIQFMKTLYKDHPYAHPESGFLDTVSKLTRDDLKAFYNQYYVAKNAMVVIVGDLDQQTAQTAAEKLISGLAPGKQPETLPNAALTKEGNTQHIEFPSKQTHVLAGLIGIDRKDEDYFNLYVGNHILGGSGLVSQLFKEVREKRGLAYSSYSYFSPLLLKGYFTMGLQTRNDQTEEAVSIMQKTLQQFVEDGPSEDQIIAAKRNITGGFAMRFDTNKKLANYVAMIGFYQLPLDYLDTFQSQVEAVTVESIKKAFQQKVNPELINTITVGASSSNSQ